MNIRSILYHLLIIHINIITYSYIFHNKKIIYNNIVLKSKINNQLVNNITIIDSIDVFDYNISINNNSLLNVLNLSIEFNTKQLANKLLDNFIKLFSIKYNLSIDSPIISFTNKLIIYDNISNTNSSQYKLQNNIINQIKSVDRNVTSIIYYNEPLNNLNYIKYPFIFPFKTLIDQSLNNITNHPPIISEDSLPSIAVNNNKKVDIINKGKLLSIENLLKRNNITALNKYKYIQTINNIKQGLRFESILYKLSNFYSVNVDSKKDSKIVSIIDGQLGSKLDNQIDNTLDNKINNKDGNIDFYHPSIINDQSVRSYNNKWRSSINLLESIKNESNYPLLIHSCIMLCQASYNLQLSNPINDFIIDMTNSLTNLDTTYLITNSSNNLINKLTYNVVNDLTNNQMIESMSLNLTIALARHAIGCPTYTSDDIVIIRTIRSQLACAIVVYDKRNKLVILVFRGTKDPIDVITDLSFTSTTLNLTNNSIDNIEVHSGFSKAFESLTVQLNELLQSFPMISKVLITGHSMGGALAQLACAHFSKYNPYLITFSTPAIGNSQFCEYINRYAKPFGGIRLFNQFDIVPYVGQLVGYEHAGIPIKRQLSTRSLDSFRDTCVNINPAIIQSDMLTSHILYQLGSIVYVFPIIGVNYNLTNNIDYKNITSDL